MLTPLVIFCTFLILVNSEASCGYSSCPSTPSDTLNVHLIPHSHDDLGWLKTFDQYYFQDVQNVITSVVGALNQNPNRTFVQVETAYFSKWWLQQNDQMRTNVKKLLSRGQFEIINGGWCMNDEAVTNYQSTIDQYTLGLRFLEDTLGECGRPRVGWQIDTFGHSREQASISAQLGFDGLFFMRLDYRDRAKRLDEKTADLIWDGSDFLDSANIFTSVFYRDTYSFPSEFCFDIVCQDEPIIDDEESPDYNYEKRIQAFAEYVRGQAAKYPSNNILVPMGDDVRYQAAFTNYLNIDRLIKGFELFPQTYEGKPIKVFYSTPSCYTKSVNDFVKANNYDLDIKTDDFLPYATDGYGYWSGFYTSRPSTKRFERQSNNFLQIAKQVTAIFNKPYVNNVTPLKEAVAVVQHHDAITGTEKQDVLKDYHRMLYSALELANEGIDPLLSSLITGDPDDSFQFKTCLLSNISSCEASRAPRFFIAVYNPLSRVVSSPVELPVDAQTWAIVDSQSQAVEYQVEPTIIDFSYVTGVPTLPYSLTFMAKDLPPLGFKIYTFDESDIKPRLSRVGTNSTNFEIDDDTGLLKTITMNGVTTEVSQDLFYYKSGSYSGAYIFVPLVNQKFRVASGKVKTSPISGDVYQGVIQEFSSWAKQIIKVYNDDSTHIEIEWVVGPIDVRDETGADVGKEIVSVITTPLQTGGNFYTDSNGREMFKRTRNYRKTFDYTNEEPIAGNYHPITSRMVLKDEEKDIELAILVDRAQGGTSLEDGQLEIMIQRACPHNDFSRSVPAVGDSINDQEYGQGIVIRGKHYIIVGPSSSLDAVEREVAQRKILAPWTFVTNQDISQRLKNWEFSSLTRPLDDRVNILTLEAWGNESILLRLENIYEEDNVNVDLSDLFSTFTITEIRETTLGANMLLEEKSRLEWPGVASDVSVEKLENFTVTLGSMQIRTFICDIVLK